MSRGAPLAIAFVLSAIMLLVGCAKKISDDTIKAQVAEYIANYTSREVLGSRLRFGDFFDVREVAVKDKFVTKTECIALCLTTYQAKQDWVAHSPFTTALGFIIGNTSGRAGETRSWEMKFVFRKYEGGWRLEGPETPDFYK